MKMCFVIVLIHKLGENALQEIQLEGQANKELYQALVKNCHYSVLRTL